VHNCIMTVFTTPKLIGVVAGFVFWILALLYFFYCPRRHQEVTSTIQNFYDDERESKLKKWQEKQEALKKEYEMLRSEKKVRKLSRTRNEGLFFKPSIQSQIELVERKGNAEDRTVEIERAGSVKEQLVQCHPEIMESKGSVVETLHLSQPATTEMKNHSEDELTTSRKEEAIVKSHSDVIYRLCDDLGVDSNDEESEPINVGSATATDEGFITTAINVVSATVSDDEGIVTTTLDFSFRNQPV